METSGQRPAPPSLDFDAGPTPEFEPVMNPGTPVAPKRGGVLLKVFAGIGITVVVAGVVGAGAFAWYVRTPEYSLAQLRTAVLEGNTAEVARYCDTEGIAEDLYDAGADQVTTAVGGELGGLTDGLKAIAKPIAVNVIQDQISSELMVPADGTPAAGLGALFTEASIDVVKESDAEAVAIYTQTSQDVAYEFELSKVDDRWRITGLRNADEIVLEYASEWLPEGTYQ